LIAGVESIALDQTLGQAKRHGRIVRPRAARKIKWAPADHVANGTERSRPTELGSGSHCIAHGKSEQRTDEALA
jgi:hypothetical protein